MDKPYEPYEHRCLREIAEKVLNSVELAAVKELIREGKVSTAKYFVKSGVDGRFRRGLMELDEAAWCYYRMSLPPRLAALFPQTHLRA